MVTHSAYRTLEIDFLGALANALVDLRGAATLAFELIQNADDAEGATSMRFDVRDEALVVENDGLFTDCDDQDSPECPWMPARGTRCDFHSFRLVQGGTKRDRQDTTGAFGIGFTSVYQITDEPQLSSGSRRWVIRLGEEVERIAEDVIDPPLDRTRLVLPWAREQTLLRERLRAQLVDAGEPERMLEELLVAVPRAMLFLRKVDRVDICRNGATIKTFIRARDAEIVTISDGSQAKNWRILTADFDGEAAALRARHPQIEPKRGSTVAIAIGDDADEDASDSAGYLYAVLPTQQRTLLTFHINADFYPSTSRKGIVLEGDYQSEWNRAALAAAAKASAQAIRTLPASLGHRRLWQIITSAKAAAQAAAQGEEDSAFEVFWEEARDAAREAETIYTSAGGWKRPDDAFLLRQPDEEAALRLLEALDLPIAHTDLRAAIYNLRGEIGIEFLEAAVLLDALETAGLDRASYSIPTVIREPALCELLWDELERMLGQQSQRSQTDQEALEHLIARSRTAPELAGGLSIWNETFVSEGTATVELFSQRFAFLDVARVGGRQHLRRLSQPFTRPAAAHALESFDANDLAAIGEASILRWFATAPLEFADDADAAGALGRLTIFPSGDGYHSLEGLLVPGGFIDPLGLTRLVTVDAVPNLTALLSVLRAPQLTLENYLRDHVPRQLDAKPLSRDAHEQLLDLIARHQSEFEDDEQLRATLAGAPLVLLNDGESVPAGQAYSNTPTVANALGNDANLAHAYSAAVARLYTWLGVAEIPRAQDVLARISRLASEPPAAEAKKAISRIIDVLAELYPRPQDRREHADWSASFMSDYEELVQLAWLPADNRDDWHEPADLYRRSREYLFSSQATFLGVPRPVEDRSVHILELLGVREEPTVRQVVDHLRACARGRETVNSQVYTFLTQRVDDEAARIEIERLRPEPCIQIDDGDYVGSWQVFWHDNSLAPIRRQLAENPFSSWRRLLDLIGVKVEPDHEDAIRLLREFSVEFGAQGSLSMDVARVLQVCWEILDRDLADGGISAAEVRKQLANVKCVPDGSGALAVPRRVLVEDMPGLADAFGAGLETRCVTRPQASWHALRAAGVRGLREAARADVRPADAEADAALLSHLAARRSEVARAVDATLEGDDVRRAMAWYDAIETRSSADLTVQWALRDGAETLTTDVMPIAALYSRERRALYVSISNGEVASWAAVAREVAALISETADPSRIAALLKEILAADTPQLAAAELDELGIPRLREPLRETLEQPVVGFGGQWMDEPAAESTGREVDGDAGGPVPTNGNSDTQTATGGADGNAPEPEGVAGPDGTSTVPSGSPNGGNSAGPRTAGGGAGRQGSTRRGTRADHGGGADDSRERGRWLVLVSGDGGTAGTGTDAASERRAAIDVAGIAEVLRYETERDRHAEEMPHENPGYDVQSRDGAGEIARFIEVKSISSSWDDAVVQLTSTQFKKAQELREKFWLYVVEYAGSPQARVRAIQDPASAATRFVFDHGWRARDEADDEGLADEPSALEERLAGATPALRRVVDAGGATPEAAYDLRSSGAPRHWRVDAAWPESHVALVGDVNRDRDVWLDDNGWAVFASDSVVQADLLAELGLDGER
jgi:hypothetical protein